MSIDTCVKDALNKLLPQTFGNGQSNSGLDERECEIYVWPQTWSDTNCGFGGMAGQMITSASTVVVVGPMQDACVFHGNRLAYKIEHVSEYFWICVKNQKMPGKRESHKNLTMEKTNAKV